MKRKQPFTKEILHALLISTDKGALDLTVPAVAAAFRAFVATLRQTGMRKSELALGAGVKFTRARSPCVLTSNGASEESSTPTRRPTCFATLGWVITQS